MIAIHGGSSAEYTGVDGSRRKYNENEMLSGITKKELEFYYGVKGVQVVYIKEGVVEIVDYKHKSGGIVVVWGIV